MEDVKSKDGEYLRGLALLPHWRNMWLRMIYCVQTIWQLLWDFPVPELDVLHQHQL